MTLFKINELLDAPCVFCKYNGPGYYQPHTHKKWCPFYEIGGDRERENAIVVFARKGRLNIDMGDMAESEKEQVNAADQEYRGPFSVGQCDHGILYSNPCSQCGR